MAKAGARIIVFGRVQGVFFRHETQVTAQGLGLSGWVRNRRDGSVEILAEGEKDQLEALIGWCHQGPAMSNVEDVKVDWQKPTGEFQGFRVEYTS